MIKKIAFFAMICMVIPASVQADNSQAIKPYLKKDLYYKKHYQPVTRLKSAETIPAYSMKDLDNKQVTFSLADRPTIISVFTTWCSVCKVELKHLNEDYKKIKANNLPIDVVVINAGESVSKTKKYKKRRQLDMPMLVDHSLKFSRDLQIIGTPTVLIFDEKKKLLYQGSSLPEEWLSYLIKQTGVTAHVSSKKK